MKVKHTKSILRLIMLLSLAALMVFSVACSKNKGNDGDVVFTLDKTNIELTVDENVEVLTLTVANVEETPEWTSSNSSIATVTVGATPNKATVRGVAQGNAVISVAAGGNIAVCTVKVNPGTHLELITESLELLVGRTGNISVDTDITSLTYSSDNTSVATVNESGLVTGISAGTANITVSGGNKNVVCPVTVIGPSVSITKPANAEEVIQLTLKDGENTYQLEAESNGEIEWKTGDSSIATVDGEGLVTAVAEGETTVTASYGSAEDTRTVKVKGELITVTLNETEYTLQPNGNFTLEATVTSSMGELDDKSVKWEIIESKDTEGNDADIVSLENGLVTSLGDIYGTVKIRATSNKDADSWAECTVTVPDPYADWIKIKDKESLINAFKAGNEAKNMYLTGDVDLDGATINSTLGVYSGKFEGRGYEIMNFTSGNLFGGVASTGVIERLAITCTLSDSLSQKGLFGMEMAGTIENCRFDVTFGNSPYTAVFGLFANATTTKISNTILLLHNPSNTANVHAGFVQGSKGQLTNVYYTVYEGSVSAQGPVSKTDAALRQTATFEEWDTDIWQIEEGEIPTLKNGGNIGEVRISLNEEEITLHKDDSFTLVATVKPAKLPTADKAVTWESSDESVATVDENGVITALKEGTATITATSVKDNTKSVTCSVTVDAATVIDLTSPESVQLEIGEQSQITATVNNGALIYGSSDNSVATVDENGKITAVSAGEITITVQSDESAGKSVIITVKVMPEVQISIEGETEFDMEIGETHELILNNNREDDKGVWASSDDTVATVDENGVITAIKDGKVNVTYTSQVDGAKRVTVKVTVQPEIELDVPTSIIIKTGLATDLGAVVSRGGVTYVSSDEETVTVDGQGKLTGLKEGTATVTVTSVIDETKTIDCEVTVSDTVEVTISLDKTSAKLDWDETITLTVRVNVPGVTWATSDDTVATVEASGDATATVTAQRKDGTATITVTSTEDPEKSATFEVTVEYVEPVITVTNPASDAIEMEIGDTQVVEWDITKGTASIEIEGAEGVLSLNGNVLTARSAGSVTVKIVSSERDGMFVESFTVTVPELPTVEITNAATAAEGVKLGTPLTLAAQANREDGTYAWASSDEGVATVDNNGAITTVSEGTVEITVTFTTESGKTATASVEFIVYDEAILELSLKARSVSVNGTYQIGYKAAGGAVVWTSSNPAIATVDETGKVTGKALGKSVITATVEGTAKTATIVIQVYNKTANSMEVYDANSFTAALKSDGTRDIFVVNDIDFAGASFSSSLNGFRATFNGLGYELSNFSINYFFHHLGEGAADAGVVENLKVKVDGSKIGANFGLFGHRLESKGVIRNCYIDITYGTTGFVSAIGLFSNGKVENTIINAHNPNGTANVFAGTVQNSGGLSQVFYLAEGNVGANGATVKTEAQLKSASSFNASWEEGWVIIDGEMPQLKGALVTEPLKVKLDKQTTEVYVGETDTLTAIVTPSELTEEERAVTWESSDESIATVNANGVVNGVKAGTAVIKAVSVKDGEVYAECTVTVNAITLSINAEDKITELKLDAQKQLHATANRGEYEWTSSNDSVATVDENGLVTATGEGSVTITVTSKLDSAVSDSITIEVKNTVIITVELDKTELKLDRGATATLTATLTNSDNGVTWSSSDDTIATVDENGVITALGKNGKVTITATSVDLSGDEHQPVTATCEVTVEYVKEEITVEKTELLIPVGSALSVGDIATASKGAFTLSLKEGSEEGVITVENNKITALGSGEATVVLTWSIDYEDIADDIRELTVTVFAPTVELSIDTAKRTLKAGETSAARILHVTMDNMPAEPKAEDIVWTSSNTAVVDTITAGYADNAYTGTLNAAGEGYTVITATYTVEGIEYKITGEVAVFAATGSWTAVYNAATFKAIWTSSGNYYLAHDLDLDGATISTGNRGGYMGTFDGRGFTISNFTTDALFMYNQSGTIKNVKLVCTLENKVANEGLIGHHTIGGTISDCYFDITFGKNSTAQSPAMANHMAGGTIQNVIIVARNTNSIGGTWADFCQGGGGTVTNLFACAADGTNNRAMRGTAKTEAQLTSEATYDEGWSEQWIITDGEYPELKHEGFPEAHRHVFSKEWTTDGTNHWHVATCGDTEEVADFGAHDTDGLDGACSVCGYLPEGVHRHTYSENWSSDETNHWKVTLCDDHDEEIVLLAAHDTNGPQKSCSVCGYIAPLSYDLTFSPEGGMPTDKWVFWKGDDAATAAETCGGTYENGTVEVTFSENGVLGDQTNQWYGTQIFYKDSAVTNNTAATITMTVTSTESGHIQINGQSIELVANEAKEITLKGAGGNALITIQMGTPGGGVDIAAATVTFSNITITQ